MPGPIDKATLADDIRLLSEPALFRQRALVNGDWVEACSGKVLEVLNPATLAVLGTVPDMGQAETWTAISAAAEAYDGWRRTLAKDRAMVLRRWGDLMQRHRDDLAIIMTLEQGKPLAEARGEIDYASSFLHWFAEEAPRAYGEVIPAFRAGQRLMVHREPVGVTAAITPWNFPSAMITRKAGAALAAGCPMIVRPASETPYSALALGHLAEQAGLPAGVFQVITGSGSTIGRALTGSTTVRKVSFTGSTEVGRLLLSQSAATVKKVSMELGGHAPFIAFDDVDPDSAVAGAIDAKFQTTGQDCLAANRIYVQEGIYDQFVCKFAEAVAAMRVGPGLMPGVEQGPLMDERAVEKCEAQVADAIEKGARLVQGGQRRPDLGPQFFDPTVLADVTDDMAIARDETFGPVAAVMRFSTEEEVVQRANNTEYGLAAYVFSRDLDRLFRVSDALEYGMIGVNAVRITGAPIPFGGQKQSGLGREGSRHGLDDYTELKYICLGQAG